MATYLPINMKALHVTNPLSAGLYYNSFLMLGAIIGLYVVDKVSRRLFLLGTCYVGAIFTSLLVFNVLSSTGVIIISGITALVCMMANNLPTIYLPELFPTSLRGRGIALGVASGRAAGTASTFLMPLVIRNYGISVGMGLCVAVLLVCGIGCQLWAPETKNVPPVPTMLRQKVFTRLSYGGHGRNGNVEGREFRKWRGLIAPAEAADFQHRVQAEVPGRS
jgi:putative MFS transporter